MTTPAAQETMLLIAAIGWLLVAAGGAVVWGKLP